MKQLKVCVTFDVDLSDYTNDGAEVDELAFLFSEVIPELRRDERLRATWFVRLDAQVEALYGHADYFFERYEREFRALSAEGHEIGWHPHSYLKTDEGWKQNTSSESVREELERYAPRVKGYGIKSVRTGWGFHTNETMRALSDSGFLLDSSAIPRPAYSWESSRKDWETTPCEPYFPSQADYRAPGEPHLSILEVPMSVTEIAAPYDRAAVTRYINLAYHPELMKAPLAAWLERKDHLVTITHPYELMPAREAHGLLAFDLNAMRRNLSTLEELAEERGAELSFMTLSEFALMTMGVENHA
ncbi:MAG: hypothetical protein ICV60_05955 [Pyrinomonadaceae bacterium]|nr:hypothetical protein [Pyrinomonadaceae bacterium]